MNILHDIAWSSSMLLLSGTGVDCYINLEGNILELIAMAQALDYLVVQTILGGLANFRGLFRNLKNTPLTAPPPRGELPSPVARHPPQLLQFDRKSTGISCTETSHVGDPCVVSFLVSFS